MAFHMGFPSLLVFFFVFHHFLLLFCDSSCPKSFTCQYLTLEYPFTKLGHPPECGLIEIDCDSFPTPKIFKFGTQYDDVDFDVTIVDFRSHNLTVRDNILKNELNSRNCPSSSAPPFSIFPDISFTSSPNLTLFKCDKQLPDNTRLVEAFFEKYECYHQGCEKSTLYYKNSAVGNLPRETDLAALGCHSIQLPVNPNGDWSDDLFKLLTYDYTIQWHVSDYAPTDPTKDYAPTDPTKGHPTKDYAPTDPTKGHPTKGNDKKKKVILAAAIPGAAFLVCLLVCFIIWRNKKRVKDAYGLPRNISSDPSSNSDIEGGSLYMGIPVFSYTELVEATNNFDSSRELGDGGFGTVYYGKLRDGREVAIKRLYEHNYRRVEQFMNEIKILTCLKHPNLVTLYGCTSRTSRELLLVYEYIENGTVADNLHGERADESPLTWPIRLNIAIETATALTYLHRSDIIHRDVKTNNILLTGNFCVKVADFGLSRLFPTDATHISTAPQGTPGYVDPEYHQCYQLTGKSDVYSFGVVLVELISSMPAVDINRHRHEINLANFALNKIQKCAFDELIDSSLGYGTDAEVTRMTTSVAELAFRCLQPEKDMRPSMDEVLDYLKDIQSGDEENRNGKMLHSPETDEVMLLKNKNLLSPVAVTDKWISSSSTIESSIE